MSATAYELLEGFRARHTGRSGRFAISRLILLARVIPEEITPDTDDPALAERIAEAIERIEAHEAQRARVKQIISSARTA